MLILLLFAIILFGSGLANFLGRNDQMLQAAASFMSGFAFLFTAVILVPSTFFALQRISGKEFNLPWLSKFRKINHKRILFAAIITLLIGGLLGTNESLSLFALPPIHAIASSLIIYWLLIWALQDIELGTPQRYWGVLAAGIILGPLLAILMEVFFGAFLLIIGVIYISSQSQYAGLIDYLSQINTFGVNEQLLMEKLSPLAADPIIVILALVFISFLVPLIEELVKPIGLYFSIGRNWSPASGFALGALSGAGFALFENLALGVSANAWLPVMVARIGTTSIHLLTSGLIGWALVRAKNERRYWQLLGTYFLSVSLHGLWNGLALLAGLSSFDATKNFIDPNALTSGMLLGLLILALGSIFLLRFNNRRFVNAD